MSRHTLFKVDDTARSATSKAVKEAQGIVDMQGGIFIIVKGANKFVLFLGSLVKGVATNMIRKGAGERYSRSNFRPYF